MNNFVNDNALDNNNNKTIYQKVPENLYLGTSSLNKNSFLLNPVCRIHITSKDLFQLQKKKRDLLVFTKENSKNEGKKM